jgi:hypothetical protein
MLVLGGCSLSESPSPVLIQEQSVSPDVPVTSEPEQQLAIMPPEPEVIPEAVPEAEPEPLLVVPDPDTLIGYSSVRLKDLLGEPSFVRSDPPAELWQYKTASCILDLYLYDDGAANFTLTHLEFRQTRQSREDYENCLRAVITLPSDEENTGQS